MRGFVHSVKNQASEAWLVNLDFNLEIADENKKIRFIDFLKFEERLRMLD